MRIIGLAALVVTLGCGEPSQHGCPEVVDHYIDVMELPEERHDEYVAQCRAMSLSQEQMTCLAAAEDHAALLRCPVDWVRR
jgi:hypothetical protein